MLNKRSLRQWMPLILATIALFTSCEDKSGNLGLDVLPSEDLFSGTDQSSSLQGRNIDPVRLISDDPDYAIIGQIEDPFTGSTEASFITQATIGELNGKLNQSDEWSEYSVDSLVLNLAYMENWWIGNKNARHEVSVHRYNTPLSFSEDYYSDMPVEGNYDETPLASRTSSAWDALPDTVWGQEKYIHKWKFNLGEDLANEVFNYSDDIMIDWRAFRENFGSLFIKSNLIDTESQGSLVLVDLLSTESNMELFYSYNVTDSITNEVETINTSYVFPINIECLRINRLLHDHQDKVSFDDPNAEHLVVQGMAGSMVEIDFNEVQFINENGESENLFDYWQEKSNTESNLEYYGISAVDIFFEADTVPQYADENFYSPIPLSLRLYEKKEPGKYEQPIYYFDPSDTTTWSPEFSGGGYNEDEAAYQFSMAGESFKMMVEKPELRGPYYLSTPDPDAYLWKVLLKNSDNEDNLTPKIRVKHVKIQTP